MSREAAARRRPPAPSLFDALTGVVTFVADDSERERTDPDVFVAAAEIADVRRYGFVTAVSGTGSGAGLTREAARAAAIGETIERYACSVVHPEDLLFGSYEELSSRGLSPVAPSRWALYEATQAVPYGRFDESTPIDWVRADSLTCRKERLVPASMVYMPYRPSCAAAVEVSPATSTGVACASTPAEAMLKGLCELVERDAFMIAWRNRLPRQRVQLDTHSSATLFQQVFARPGLEYGLFHTTLDLPIPAFLGVLRNARRSPHAVVVGGAAHPDPEVAVRKTLLELVQGLRWMDHVRPRPLQPEEGFANVRTFDDRARLYAAGGLDEAFAFLDGGGEVALSAIPSAAAGDVATTVAAFVKQLEERGLEMLAVDSTPVDVAECGLSVVRVMVPGIEPMEGDHRYPFLGGNRWRDVPVSLGLGGAADGRHGFARNPYPHPYP